MQTKYLSILMLSLLTTACIGSNSATNEKQTKLDIANTVKSSATVEVTLSKDKLNLTDESPDSDYLVVTIKNMANVAINQLKFSLPSNRGLDISENSCSQPLEAQHSCSFQLNYHSDRIEAGRVLLIVDAIFSDAKQLSLPQSISYQHTSHPHLELSIPYAPIKDVKFGANIEFTGTITNNSSLTLYQIAPNCYNPADFGKYDDLGITTAGSCQVIDNQCPVILKAHHYCSFNMHYQAKGPVDFNLQDDFVFQTGHAIYVNNGAIESLLVESTFVNKLHK
jgi:hypothetical protein